MPWAATLVAWLSAEGWPTRERTARLSPWSTEQCLMASEPQKPSPPWLLRLLAECLAFFFLPLGKYRWSASGRMRQLYGCIETPYCAKPCSWNTRRRRTYSALVL